MNTDFLKDKNFLLSMAVGVLAIALTYSLGSVALSRLGSSDCVVFPAEYCGIGKEFTYIEEKAIGFNVPFGTEFSAPLDGVITVTGLEDTMTNASMGGFAQDGSAISIMLIGEHTSFVNSGDVVKRGDIIGTAHGTIVEGLHGSTVIVELRRIGADGSGVIDNELAEEFFGDAY